MRDIEFFVAERGVVVTRESIRPLVPRVRRNRVANVIALRIPTIAAIDASWLIPHVKM